MLYFAYGSNLCKERMAKRCPQAVEVGKYTLKDYKLVFNAGFNKKLGAFANVEPAPGHSVEGFLYGLNDWDLETLDMHEGHPFCYFRNFLIDEKLGKIQFYVARRWYVSRRKPKEPYLSIVRRGMIQKGIDYSKYEQLRIHSIHS